MAFDPSVIGSIGERATGPVSEAPFKALQLSDLTQQNQANQMTLNAQKQEQADLGYAKSYIDQNNLDISNPDDQARLVAEVATRNPKMAMSMQRDFAQNDEAQVKLREEDLKYHAARLDTMALPAEHIVETMEDMARQGKGAQEIQAYGQKAATELLSTLSKQSVGARPVLTAEDKQEGLRMLQGDIYQSLKGFVAKSQQARDAYSQYTKNQHEQATTEAAGEHIETVMKGGKPHRVMFDSKGNEKKDLGEAPPTAAMINVANQGTPDDKEKAAEGIANYKLQPPSPRSSGYRQTMAEVLKINPNYDATTWRAKNDAVTRFDTGKQGDAVRSLNVAVQHLSVLQDAFKALDNGDLKAFNAARAAYLEQTGDELPTNVDAAADFVGNEVTKAAMGAGVAGALADREGVKKNIATSVSQKQSSGQIETYTKLLAGQLRGLKKQYESGTGLDNFNEKLDPQTIKALENTTPAPAPKVPGVSPPSSSGAQGAGAGPTATGPGGKKVQWNGKEWVPFNG
jgi:hypothetical protein